MDEWTNNYYRYMNLRILKPIQSGWVKLLQGGKDSVKVFYILRSDGVPVLQTAIDSRYSE